MFSCCILPYHAYGPQKTWSQNLFTRFKGWLTSHMPHLWPFARRSSKVIPQEFGKNKTHQSFLSLTLQEGMMRHPADTSQRWAWALDTSTVDKRSFPRLWTVHNTALEHLVAHLVPAFLLCDTTFIHSFLLTYTDVATTQEVLDEFFNSYRFILYCRMDDAPTSLWKKYSLHPTVSQCVQEQSRWPHALPSWTGIPVGCARRHSRTVSGFPEEKDGRSHQGPSALTSQGVIPASSWRHGLFCQAGQGLGLHSWHMDGILSPGLLPAPTLSQLEKGIGLPRVQHARLAGGASSSPSAFTVAAP
ncbi:uncharacterized protein [Equus caballus]|uniref:uncharacterized protein isoform X3 n=1 Tax=Equus caballus TaxID=9796 RepID=UPI0038B36A1F